jgi:hypothetical protein
MSTADQYAAMTRQQWQDYVSQFIQFENELIQYATDPGMVTQAVERAGERVDQAFDAQQGIMQRRLRAKQQTLTPEEQQAADRTMNLSRSLADVGAQNVARQQTVARQRGILGAMPAPKIGG